MYLIVAYRHSFSCGMLVADAIDPVDSDDNIDGLVVPSVWPIQVDPTASQGLTKHVLPASVNVRQILWKLVHANDKQWAFNLRKSKSGIVN